MSLVEPAAPLRLLHAGYAADDWVAVFLKSYGSNQTCQRVASIAQVASPRFLAWLRSRNAAGWEIYVSVNAVTPQRRSRARDAIAAVRHVFLEADSDGPQVLAAVAARADLPAPTYLLHSSRNRVHVFWRVAGFDIGRVEALQKQLARELRTDVAATSCSQTTRLPGYFYLKSPSIRSCGKCLICQGLTYEAVTHSMEDEASRCRPTPFLVLSWHQFLFAGKKRIGSNGNASCPHLIRDSQRVPPAQLRPFVVPWN